MSGQGERRGVGGLVRTIWRVLLFAGLFVAFVVAGAIPLTVLRLETPAVQIIYQGLVTLAAALAAGWLLLRWQDGRRPGALGFAWTSRTLRELAGGMVVGAGALAAVVVPLVLLSMIRFESDAGGVGELLGTLLVDLLILGVAAAAEEALFRGYAFQVLVQGTGPVVATVLSSAAFAVAHGWNPNVGIFALVNIFLAGVMLAIGYLRTRSLWFVTAVHLGWNWMMASVFDLPVSGLEYFDGPVYTGVPVGPEWLTGGAFGPEGGLAGTIGFVLALIAVLRVPGFRPAPEMRELAPLVDTRLG